jgi:hypothetical protein
LKSNGEEWVVGERGKKKFVLCLCHVEVAGTHTTKD